jgi:hypothetical protein
LKQVADTYALLINEARSADENFKPVKAYLSETTVGHWIAANALYRSNNRGGEGLDSRIVQIITAKNPLIGAVIHYYDVKMQSLHALKLSPVLAFEKDKWFWKEPFYFSLQVAATFEYATGYVIQPFPNGSPDIALLQQLEPGGYTNAFKILHAKPAGSDRWTNANYPMNRSFGTIRVEISHATYQHLTGTPYVPSDGETYLQTLMKTVETAKGQKVIIREAGGIVIGELTDSNVHIVKVSLLSTRDMIAQFFGNRDEIKIKDKTISKDTATRLLDGYFANGYAKYFYDPDRRVNGAFIDATIRFRDIRRVGAIGHDKIAQVLAAIVAGEEPDFQWQR